MELNLRRGTLTPFRSSVICDVAYWAGPVGFNIDEVTKVINRR